MAVIEETNSLVLPAQRTTWREVTLALLFSIEIARKSGKMISFSLLFVMSVHKRNCKLQMTISQGYFDVSS